MTDEESPDFEIYGTSSGAIGLQSFLVATKTTRMVESKFPSKEEDKDDVVENKDTTETDWLESE